MTHKSLEVLVRSLKNTLCKLLLFAVAKKSIFMNKETQFTIQPAEGDMMQEKCGHLAPMNKSRENASSDHESERQSTAVSSHHLHLYRRCRKNWQFRKFRG